jgi:hypothetical protein
VTLRVETTVVSVKITFVRVKITLHLEIELCVYKSNSRVLESHFAFRNYTRVCEHHIMPVNITFCVQKLVRVNITLCV